MKHSVKIANSLTRRQAAANPTGPNPSHTAHLPGSQNRKKGAKEKASIR